MILDRALEQTVIVPEGIRRLLLAEKPSTHRFVFNADASHKVGRFGYTCADIICREAEIIPLPFHNTYIEVDNHAMIKGTGAALRADAVERIGFWFYTGSLCIIVFGDEKRAEFTPFLFGSNTAAMTYGMSFTQTSPTTDTMLFAYDTLKAMLILGNISMEHDDPEDAIKYYKKLSKQIINAFELKMLTDFQGSKHGQDLFDMFVDDNIGVLKFALSSLMLLDNRSQRTLVHTQATRRIVSGKLKAYAAHDVVTIDLDEPAIRRAYTAHIGHHATPLEHDVREHWVHYDCSSQCTHTWTTLHSEKGEQRDLEVHGQILRREICTLCGGRRTRKLPYVKGDPSKGSLIGNRKYRVIATKEQSILWKPGKPDDPE